MVKNIIKAVMQYGKILNVRNALCTMLLTTGISAFGQLHENIDVEGKYLPDIIRTERINILPSIEESPLKNSALEFELSGLPVDYEPILFTMPATGWKTVKKFSDKRGYVELGLGSWLNSTLSAGYKFLDTEKNSASVFLQHNSTSLWEPKLSEATRKIKQYRYDEGILLSYSHKLQDGTAWNVDLGYHLGLFDYYGITGQPGATIESAPGQTFNSIAFRSTLLPGYDSYPGKQLELRVNYNAYRAFPTVVGEAASRKGTRETMISLINKGRFLKENGTGFGLDGELDMLFYGGDKDPLVFTPGWNETLTLSKPDNYGMLALTPYYNLKSGVVEAHFGVDIDLTLNAGWKGDRYSFFHIAPDFKFQLRKNQIGAWLSLTGGTELNTLAALRRHDYYMMPVLNSTRPTYTPVDIKLGADFGPFSGFSVIAQLEYKVSKNVRLGGWYQTWLDNRFGRMPGLENIPDYTTAVYYSLDREGIDLHGFSFALDMEYRNGKLWDVKGGITLQPQDGEKGIFNGYDRPTFTASLAGNLRLKHLNPKLPLSLHVGWDYRGNRKIYTSVLTEKLNEKGGFDTGREYVFMKLTDLSLLNVGADWEFGPNFSIWAQVDNIFDHTTMVLPMQPMQGITFAAGLKFLF